MSSYRNLAESYDRLTGDVDYPAYAKFCHDLFNDYSQDIRLVLDLCCGTGTLTFEMAKYGYDMIAVDQSPEMLTLAQAKAAEFGIFPLFICQDAAKIDLYGTVDAAFCALDSLNYIQRSEVESVFQRLSLFIRPGGLFLFDIRTPEWMKNIDGFTSVDEDDDVFCVWRSDYDEDKLILIHGIDLFQRRGKLWQHSKEEHIEYVYSTDELLTLAGNNGFCLVKHILQTDFGGIGREFFVLQRQERKS